MLKASSVRLVRMLQQVRLIYLALCCSVPEDERSIVNYLLPTVSPCVGGSTVASIVSCFLGAHTVARSQFVATQCDTILFFSRGIAHCELSYRVLGMTQNYIHTEGGK